MKKRNFIVLLFLALVLAPTVRTAAQQIQQLPMDTAIRYGKLPNGLTYYIRHNSLPENRADFYIAQKVGSVQEDDNQRGLAHFLEHMCFNGTDHFPGNRVIKYLEGIGVQFGSELNAYTSTDETVYNIDNVPVTDSNVDSCLWILHDWADGLTLDPAEIDKERGVIHEEWRLRSSGDSRIYERNLPTLYPGSRYGERWPIGLMEIIDNFKPEFLRAYYEKWYRPDLQGIIVVGDVDVDQVEEKIKAIFGPIQMPANPAAYEHYPVPVTPEPIYVIDKDKEMQQSIMLVNFKHEPLPDMYKNTPIYFAQNLITTLACQALNARLNELSQEPDCPFIGAGAYDGQYLISKTMDAFRIAIMPKPGQDQAALQAVMQEVERASRYGFTATEILRARDEFISSLERIYDNREKQQNNFYVQQYVRNFLENDPIPDIETEFNLYKMMSQQLPAEAVSATFKQFTASTDTNFVFFAMYPEKEGVAVPTADQMKQAIAAAKAAKLEAYVDSVNNDPLVPQLPAKGQIKKEEAAPFGYTCWTLDNGARVYFRHTDFNDSEVLFRAESKGGKSRTDAKDYVNVELLTDIMSGTGLGAFTATELEKKLAGKQAHVSVALGEATEGLSGSATPKDLRTLFELIYLRFQAPANDPDGYNNTLAYLKSQLENADKVPETALTDSLRATLYGHNPLARSLHVADLAQADYATIRRIYSERFAAGGDFDFYFTGNFNTDSLRLYVEQYIAPLKAVSQRETFVDRNIVPVTGTVDNHFVRKMETPKAYILQMWTGDEPYTVQTAATVDALGQVLTQRMLKSIREEHGLAYSVGAPAMLQYGIRDQYLMQVVCPVQPAKLDSALLLINQTIEEVARKGVTDDELANIRKMMLKTYDDQQKQNSYWHGNISAKVAWNKDTMTGVKEAITALKPADLQKFVKDVLLKRKNCVTVTMLPADLKE